MELSMYAEYYTKAQESGLSCSEYCRRHGIDYHCFSTAIYRLRKLGCLKQKENHVRRPRTVSIVYRSGEVPALNEVTREKRDMVLRYYSSGMGLDAWCRANGVRTDVLYSYMEEMEAIGIGFVGGEYLSSFETRGKKKMTCENKSSMWYSFIYDYYQNHTDVTIADWCKTCRRSLSQFYYYRQKLAKTGVALYKRESVEKYWRSVIAEYYSEYSDISLYDWCSHREISVREFCYYKRKLETKNIIKECEFCGGLSVDAADFYGHSMCRHCAKKAIELLA